MKADNSQTGNKTVYSRVQSAMYEPTVRHYYVKLNKSFVHLVQYGHHENIIRSPVQSSSNRASSEGPNNSSLLAANHTTLLADRNKLKKLIVFVPGNPGILGIYHDFLSSLYKTLSKPSNRGDDPVILAIGNNNFDHPDHCDYSADERICVEENGLNFVEKSTFGNNQEPHQVELQIMSKMIILKRLLKANLCQTDVDSCRLTFVGHSFGAYIILRLLQDRTLAQAHAGSILIHPALENLALTEKGTILSRYFALKLDYVLRFVAYVAEKVILLKM